MDLSRWRKHIDAVVADEGQWVGVLDENGYPIYTLGGLQNISFPENRLSPSSVEVTLAVSVGDQVVDDLAGEGLGRQDASGGELVAPGATRLIMLVRAGGERRAATITHTTISGGATPTSMTIHGVDLLDSLSWWPCPSIPVEWSRTSFTTQTTDVSRVTYVHPRDMAIVRFSQLVAKVTAEGVVGGYAKTGAAVTVISDLIQDSFDAVNHLYGWMGKPHAVVVYEEKADGSPRVGVRVNDDPILDTVAEPARAAGVGIEVSLWWPGDEPLRVRRGDRGGFEVKSFNHPIQVVRVSELKG